MSVIISCTVTASRKVDGGDDRSGEPFFYRERRQEEEDADEVQLYVVVDMPPLPRGGDTMRVQEDDAEAAAVVNVEQEPELEEYFPKEDPVRVQELLRQLSVNNLLGIIKQLLTIEIVLVGIS